MQLESRPISKRARFGLLAMNVLLAATLVGSAVIGYLDARQSREAVIRARAFDMLASTRRTLRSLGKPSKEMAQELFGEMAPQGLTYLLVVDFKGNRPFEAGLPKHQIPSREVLKKIKEEPLIVPSKDGPVQIIDRLKPKRTRKERIRMRQFMRRGGDGHHFPREHAMRERWQRWQRPSAHYLLLEFEPVVANSIERRAVMNLLICCVGALVLFIGVIIFWRQWVREESYIETLSRDEQLKRLGEMSAILGHEIRNPLASLKGHAQLLVEKLKDGEERTKNKADIIVKEAVRIERLTQQILDFAKTGSLSLMAIDPCEILQEAATEVGEDKVRLELPEECSPCMLDRDRLVQVVTNLIRNGLEAQPTAGKVQVSLRKGKDNIVFEIRDEGPGVDTDAAGHIFEPFQTGRVHGTGLGLTVAKRIVEGHEGTISVENHPGGGAVFRVELPRKQPPETEEN